MRDRTQAVLDRMIIIPFNASFNKSDPDYDPFISDKLKSREAIEYLIRVGIEGL
jgi:putative DNA primase/helicase